MIAVLAFTLKAELNASRSSCCTAVLNVSVLFTLLREGIDHVAVGKGEGIL